jgi:hypothetical protein
VIRGTRPFAGSRFAISGGAGESEAGLHMVKALGRLRKESISVQHGLGLG